MLGLVEHVAEVVGASDSRAARTSSRPSGADPLGHHGMRVMRSSAGGATAAPVSDGAR